MIQKLTVDKIAAHGPFFFARMKGVVSMAKAEALIRVVNDLSKKDLGMAREQITGLVNSYFAFG